MKAVRYYGPRILRYEDVETPRPARGEVRVRNEVALTCGTDLKILQRGHPLVKPPLILGHEFAGVIDEIGEGVRGLVEGMRVAAVNSAPCGACFYCVRGSQNLCRKVTDNLIGFTLPGAYAEYVVVPSHIVEQNMFEVPSHVSFEQIALLEPFACVVHGNYLAPITPEDTAVVIGAGPIGLMHVALARYRGAAWVIVVDISASRLDAARAMGATHTFCSEANEPRTTVEELTEGRGADIVIEAVGRVETWEKAFELVRPGGTVIMFGGCPSSTTVKLSTEKLHYGEVTVKGSFHHEPASVKKAFDLLARGSVCLKPLVTDSMPLSKAQHALEKMASGDALKVALYPK